jgi:hypothetical protein
MNLIYIFGKCFWILAKKKSSSWEIQFPFHLIKSGERRCAAEMKLEHIFTSAFDRKCLAPASDYFFNRKLIFSDF